MPRLYIPEPPTDGDLDALLAWRADRIAEETCPLFMERLPVRWLDAEHPKFRCTRGHISTVVLTTETRGDRCLACFNPIVMTFPEDEEKR